MMTFIQGGVVLMAWLVILMFVTVFTDPTKPVPMHLRVGLVLLCGGGLSLFAIGGFEIASAV